MARLERPITADDPVISVVIPTIPQNSHDAVVAALAKQDFDGEYEVLVVNDDDIDICEARNAGIEAATGALVALTDDDCRPPRKWLATLVETFDAYPDVICVEGAVTGGRTYEGSRRYVGCNLAFRRNVALAAGGFRSAYAGWRDDTEFGWRMEERGKCLFVESAVMAHPPRPRAEMDPTLEAKFEAEYPRKYDEVIRPDTIAGRVNDWLWRKGFWELVDSVRYRT